MMSHMVAIEIEVTADQCRADESFAPTSDAARPQPRRRAEAAVDAEKTGKRGLYLSDGVWERLQLEAILNKTTISAVCEDVLSRNLARLRIERDA
jgi:hypothetical protein